MRITKRRTLAALALPAAAVIALAGCTGDDSGETTGGDDTYAKLTLGMTADLTGGWDIVDQPPYQSWGIEAVYEPLVRCLPGGELTAAAAESWEISEDNRSFTATLREGATYSDGTPVDAESVAASYDVVKETASDRYGDITYEIADPQTITISWPEPQPLMNVRVCSPYLASIDFIESDDRDTSPVGSGPYTYDAAASTPGSAYTLVKNDDYWNTDAYPYETLELRVLEDETASLNALKTGQIDGTIISATTYDEAESSGMEITGVQAGLLMIHLTDRLGEVIPALGDVRVRQAMNMVIDKQAVVDQLWDGHAEPIWQPFQLNSQAILDIDEPYPYDVEEAKALMAEAGYEDGFTMTIPTMEGQGWTVIIPYLTQQLAELNITLEQDALSGPDAIATLLSGDYPVPVWQVGGQTSVEDITVHVLDTGFWNVLHQPNETIDALWEEIVTGDEAQQIAAQQEINQYLVDNAWFVPILSPYNYYAYNADKVTVTDVSDPNGLHPKLIDFQ
ncbi:ABC transporter substrate-binding protein [Agromyces mangrovi Wang et al. 2018]|uniref:ABC transporter substrate-binding protein n=1 Tax=Agromyces mangrovi TaxID=1858653 RepID=UPI0025748D60|nr:ABC transporter substrate-binding protein [Agromyces mangrovi]BDZ65086.1 peptide ABC transporter substrate-binding protein [Agromyces mangrovi]